ncbi:MAG: PLP-dependent aminotransferase family protein, partial [Clostridia bacterium]|nr:PLP-dependent aminotransferase family protein [Clostridia bacterium]
NEGDTVICENPSFIGALNAFRSYNTNLVGVDLEDDGINIEALENALKANPNTKIIYVIPTFQNPAGITTSLEKRKAVIALAEKYGVIILEDNPYGELRFSGEDVPTMKSLDKNGVVVYCSSFSKVLSAGMRIGFLCGRSDIIQKVVVAKQVNDVHTNIFFQLLASDFIEKYGLDDHIKGIRQLYREKCSLMLSEMDKHFPKHIKYTRPDGGLFIWVTLPEKYDADLFAKEGVKEKVAVVSGTAFTPKQGDSSCSFRMNYSTPSDEQIVLGVERLGKLLERYI